MLSGELGIDEAPDEEAAPEDSELHMIPGRPPSPEKTTPLPNTGGPSAAAPVVPSTPTPAQPSQPN